MITFHFIASYNFETHFYIEASVFLSSPIAESCKKKVVEFQ